MSRMAMNFSPESFSDLNEDGNLNDQNVPVHLITDYIEVVYLPAAICVGTFLNALVFRRLWRQWHRMDGVFGQRKSYLLLKFNLNIADFMVLLIYAFGRFCWVAAYQWYGGDILCRAYHFLSLVAFHMTAFVMVTIAIDRLRAIYSTVVLRNKRKRSSRLVRNMIIFSWALAIILSSGQLCIWTVFAPPFETDFVQCTTIWEVRKVQNNTMEQRKNDGIAEVTYTLIHLLSAFWIPLLIIAASYTLVCVRYLNHVLAIAGRWQRREVATETVRLSSTRFTDISCSQSLRRTYNSVIINTDRKVETSSVESPVESRSQLETSRGASQTRQSSAVVQCRSRVFRTSGLVILCYLCCWTPYNVLALWKVVDPPSFYPLSEQLNILNALIVLNSVFNPLIYGFH